jgi:peroxiredoxin
MEMRAAAPRSIWSRPRTALPRMVFLFAAVASASGLAAGEVPRAQDSVPSAVAPASLLGDHGRAPQFQAERYDGGRVALRELLQKGPVIVDFWATWCVPCKRALPHYQALQQRYAERGVAVLLISLDDPRSQPKIGPYVKSQKLTLPVLLDAQKQVSRLFQVSDIPSTFLISPTGRIVAVHVGYNDGDEALLERELRELLGLPPLPEQATPVAPAPGGSAPGGSARGRSAPGAATPERAKDGSGW